MKKFGYAKFLGKKLALMLSHVVLTLHQHYLMLHQRHIDVISHQVDTVNNFESFEIFLTL